MSKLPTIEEYRAALAGLIVQKDAISTAITNYTQQLDLAAQTLEQMLERAEDELIASTDEDDTDS